MASDFFCPAGLRSCATDIIGHSDPQLSAGLLDDIFGTSKLAHIRSLSLPFDFSHLLPMKRMLMIKLASQRRAAAPINSNAVSASARAVSIVAKRCLPDLRSVELRINISDGRKSYTLLSSRAFDIMQDALLQLPMLERVIIVNQCTHVGIPSSLHTLLTTAFPLLYREGKLHIEANIEP